MVVEDKNGVWLVQGYECYKHCKSLVEKGELPEGWGVYTLRYTAKLSWEVKVGVGLHAGLKTMLVREQDVSLIRLLLSVWHLNRGRSFIIYSKTTQRKQAKIAMSHYTYVVLFKKTKS